MDDYKPGHDPDGYAFDYNDDDSRKRTQHHDDDDDNDFKKRRTQQPTRRLNKDGTEKPKLSRGSRACLVCRKVKMRCIGAGEGVKCKRCLNGGHDCIFEESNRGKRSTKKPDQLNNSLSSMSETIEGVLKTLTPGTPQSDNSQYSSAEPSTSRLPHNNSRPVLNSHTIITLEKLMNGSRTQQLEAASWLMQFQESLLSYNNQIIDQNHKMAHLHNKQLPHVVGKSVTPLDQLVNAFQASSPRTANNASAFERTTPHNTPHNRQASFDKPKQSYDRSPSPKLHSLPDDTLNPLGLLAEASLNNRRYSARNSQRPDLQTILNIEENGGSSPTVNEKEKNEQVEAMIRDQKSEGIGVASDEYYKPGALSCKQISLTNAT